MFKIKKNLIKVFNGIFGNIVKKILRKRLRRIIRGHQRLKNAKRSNIIASVNQTLTVKNLPIHRDLFSERVFGVNALKNAEKITRQYLLARIGGTSLNKALLHSVGKENGKVIYPLPGYWRKIIELEGFSVSNFFCALLWQIIIFVWFFFGVYRIIKTFLSGINNFNSKSSPEKHSSYVYFDGLDENNFPISAATEKNIFSWYLQWTERNENVNVLRHNVKKRESQLNIGNAKVQFQNSPVPSLCGMGSAFKYLWWGLTVSLFAFLDMLRGRWWHAFLLNQAAVLGRITYNNPSRLAIQYFFNNSGWIYRPLWTYEAEALGSSIIFYFYSTNCENFMLPNGKTSPPYGWQSITWARYLVWDKRQADFIKEMTLDKVEITVVGDIWFQSELEFNYLIAKSTIAVFDVQAYRESFYYPTGPEIEYYVPDTSILFLSDIDRLSEKINAKFALKIKRQKSKSTTHPRYRHFLYKLSTSQNFINIDPLVGARDIIDKCSAVISMPFTSTALLGRAAGKPSIYYDPIGLIQKNDPAAHGIPIISGEDELIAWISSIQMF